MATKYNKLTSAKKRRQSVAARRKALQAVCLLVIILGMVMAIRAKSTAGMALSLLLCAFAVFIFVLLWLAGLRQRLIDWGRRNNDPQTASSGTRPATSKRSIPASGSRDTRYRRSAIDIPLDDEVRVERQAVQATSAPQKAPTVTAQAETREDEQIAKAPDEPAIVQAAESKVVDFANYKITPPKHNPELFKRQDNKVVIWPGGKVVPVTEPRPEPLRAEDVSDGATGSDESAPAPQEAAALHVDFLPPDEAGAAFDFEKAEQESAEKQRTEDVRQETDSGASDSMEQQTAPLPQETPGDSEGDVDEPGESAGEALHAEQELGEAESLSTQEDGNNGSEGEPVEEASENGTPAIETVSAEVSEAAAADVIYLSGSTEPRLLLKEAQSDAETAKMDETSEDTAPRAGDAEEQPDDPNVIYLPESLEEGSLVPGERAEARDSETADTGASPEETPAKETTEWSYPPYALLDQARDDTVEEAGAELSSNAARLADTLKSFGVEATAGDAVRGPAVTRYEFTLEPGVKLSKLTNLQDDIALALGASGVRIAPVPDKSSVVGVEVPNRVVSPVSIRSLLESPEFLGHPSPTAFAVGKDISGGRIVGDIARFPHVLIAGTTGSGKSVCTNSLIVSMLYKSTPEEVRFIMVDPKMVELAPYNGIPHLLIPVVTDPKKAAGALQWAVYEMMKRYKLFSERNVKDLAAYNALAEADPSLQKLPTVVVVIDELADLMLIAAKEVEESICRVAQMGRAAGMHLVIATQSPRADVITGLMKANIPSRIAFAVASSLESRIILDNVGAEKLVGKGDMLYAPLGQGKPQRVQGCFISAAEIERVVEYLKAHGEADYDAEVIEKIDQAVAEKEGHEKPAPDETHAEDGGDPLLEDAIEVILETGQASTSMLQRRLKLGYSRAARLVDQMEEMGVVGPFEGSKPRQILITRASWEARKEAANKVGTENDE